MGAFASLLTDEESKIPKNKRKEFIERARKVLRQTGMMEMKLVSLFDTRLTLLCEPEELDYGIVFRYNYFEQRPWEDCSVSKKDACVYTNKLGSGSFARACLMLHSLEAQYVDGPSIVEYDGDFRDIGPYAGCLNHILGTEFPATYTRPWAIFEMLHEHHPDWLDSKEDMDAFLLATIAECKDYLDAHIVINGSGCLLTDEETDNYTLSKVLRGEKRFIEEFKASDSRSEEQQIDYLLDLLRLSCTEEGKSEVLSNMILYFMMIALVCYHCPGSAVKMIAEVYDRDFWSLWDRVKDDLNRLREAYNPPAAAPVSVEEFFGEDKDDLVFLWSKESPIAFSGEMEAWLGAMRRRFDVLMTEGFEFANPMKRIFLLLERAERIYCRLYAFESFLNESLERIYDRRYLALWKIFEEMVDDPENIKAAEPDGDPYFEWKRLCLPVRTPMRRYLALVANRGLREEVFGF